MLAHRLRRAEALTETVAQLLHKGLGHRALEGIGNGVGMVHVDLDCDA
jgi:hypothetical protein